MDGFTWAVWCGPSYLRLMPMVGFTWAVWCGSSYLRLMAMLGFARVVWCRSSKFVIGGNACFHLGRLV